MEIFIQLDEPAWRLAGQRRFSVSLEREHCTVAELIGELDRRFAGMGAELSGKTGDMIPYSLFLNDDSVRWTEIEHIAVKQGDRLRVILPIAGG